MILGTDITPYRFGWYLVNEKKTLDFSIMHRAMTRGDYDEFRKFTKVVEDLRPFNIDFMALKADGQAVEAVKPSIEGSFNEMLANGFVEIPRSVAVHAEAQRVVSNFLSSASAFRDRSATRLTRRHGKQHGSDVERLNLFISRIYDRSFTYRLLHALRNHAQHHENPLSLVKTDAVRSNDGNLLATVDLQVNTSMLIANKKINATFRGELSRRVDDKIDLIPLIQENMREHSAIFAFILERHKLRIQEMIYYGLAIYNLVDPPPGAFPCVFDGPEPGRIMMMGFDEMMDYERIMAGLDSDLQYYSS